MHGTTVDKGQGMTEKGKEKTYFTVNISCRYREMLTKLAEVSRRPRANVLEVLIEQAARQPSLVGIPSILDAEEPARNNPTEDAGET